MIDRNMFFELRRCAAEYPVVTIHDRGLRPDRWYADYIATYLERDLRQMSPVHDLSLFQRFLTNVRKRLTRSPKIYLLDTRLGCHLLGINSSRQLETHPLRGAVFENWVAAELLKQALNAGRRFASGEPTTVRKSTSCARTATSSNSSSSRPARPCTRASWRRSEALPRCSAIMRSVGGLCMAPTPTDLAGIRMTSWRELAGRRSHA